MGYGREIEFSAWRASERGSTAGVPPAGGARDPDRLGHLDGRRTVDAGHRVPHARLRTTGGKSALVVEGEVGVRARPRTAAATAADGDSTGRTPGTRRTARTPAGAHADRHGTAAGSGAGSGRDRAGRCRGGSRCDADHGHGDHHGRDRHPLRRRGEQAAAPARMRRGRERHPAPGARTGAPRSRSGSPPATQGSRSGERTGGRVGGTGGTGGTRRHGGTGRIGGTGGTGGTGGSRVRPAADRGRWDPVSHSSSSLVVGVHGGGTLDTERCAVHRKLHSVCNLFGPGSVRRCRRGPAVETAKGAGWDMG